MKDAFELVLAHNTKRGRSSDPIVDMNTQPSVSSFIEGASNSSPKLSWVSQATVDNAVLRLVVETGQSFRFVEQESFISLMGKVQPTKKVLSRYKLKELMDAKFKGMQGKIREALEEVEHVSTTADIWSSSHRSFLGVTVHALTNTMGRRNYAIACRRLQGSHTYDVVAHAINDVLQEWGIQFKTSGMVTDNATNFIKAFRRFGTQSQVPAFIDLMLYLTM